MHNELEQRTVLTLREKNEKISPPLFFSVPFRENIPDQIFNLTPSLSTDLRVEGHPASPSLGGVIFLPAPDGMVPSQVKIVDLSGAELQLNKYFWVTTDPLNHLFAIKLLRKTKRKLSFQVDYHQVREKKQIPEELLSLNDFSRLENLITLLRGAGFIELPDTLSKMVELAKLKGLSLSLTEIAKVFKIILTENDFIYKYIFFVF
jgi:hypothetical protein